MYDFLLPVIQSSTDVTQPQHVYLVEDGLELWQVTLLNAPSITPGLLDLYKNMPELLGKRCCVRSFSRLHNCLYQMIDCTLLKR